LPVSNQLTLGCLYICIRVKYTLQTDTIKISFGWGICHIEVGKHFKCSNGSTEPRSIHVTRCELYSSIISMYWHCIWYCNLRSGLKRFKYRLKSNETISDRPVVSVFEEAVMLGSMTSSHPHENCESSLMTGSSCQSQNNATNNQPPGPITNGGSKSESECQLKYALCPLSTKDILHYVRAIRLKDF
jgi:hypothetical protein